MRLWMEDSGRGAEYKDVDVDVDEESRESGAKGDIDEDGADDDDGENIYIGFISSMLQSRNFLR